MNFQNPQMQNGVIDLSTLGAKPASASKVHSPYIVDIVEDNLETE